jgi:hypothetical protein
VAQRVCAKVVCGGKRTLKAGEWAVSRQAGVQGAACEATPAH